MDWEVRFNRRCSEWHPQSSPYVVTEFGEIQMPQNVGHPGLLDPGAVALAETIVRLSRFKRDVWQLFGRMAEGKISPEQFAMEVSQLLADDVLAAKSKST